MALKQVNKNNSVNNIISIPGLAGDTKLKEKNSKNVLSSFYFNGGIDPKLNKRFIKSVEKQVRRSKEYATYVGFLDNDMELNTDVYMSNIDNEMATLQFHHYPFTLYEIVEIVLNKHIMNKDKYTSFDIVDEVLNLHYQNKVGLVHLTTTNHELVHAGKLFIPLDSVFGKVNTFIDEYRPYLFDDQIDTYNQLVQQTAEYKANLPENIQNL